jgi:ABC-type arginine transport system ATPase subunit
MKISLQTPICRSPRVMQVEGMFDLPPVRQAARTWDVSLPLDERRWNVGLIVGPSGSGKTTLARHLWPDQVSRQMAWPGGRAALDAFPEDMSIKEIVSLLSSVGFSSPPDWLRPLDCLSTGQQFRVTLARLLAEAPDLAVMDEFTSVVDRTVAQIGAHAVAKAVRRRDQKFVALTCHEDVAAWLDPDWIYRPACGSFTWRSLRRRPAIRLQIGRVSPKAWKLFHQHHYLSTKLAPAAVCFGAWWRGRLVAFSAWIHSLTAGGGRREHRTVTLPDYQGAGIGHALSTWIAAMWQGLGQRATSTTSHPAMIWARSRSADWRMTRAPGLANRNAKLGHAVTRLTAGFEYVGPPMPSALAARLLDREKTGQ